MVLFLLEGLSTTPVDVLSIEQETQLSRDHETVIKSTTPVDVLSIEQETQLSRDHESQ